MSDETEVPENLAEEFRRLYKLWMIGFGNERDALMMFIHLNADRIEAALRRESEPAKQEHATECVATTNVFGRHLSIDADGFLCRSDGSLYKYHGAPGDDCKAKPKGCAHHVAITPDQKPALAEVIGHEEGWVVMIGNHVVDGYGVDKTRAVRDAEWINAEYARMRAEGMLQ